MVVWKDWGSEQILTNKEYCVKRLTVYEGMMCSLHRHPLKAEGFYVLSGCGIITVQGTVHHAATNVFVHVAPGQWHRFGSKLGMVLLESSTHHNDADVERSQHSGEFNLKRMLADANALERGRKLPIITQPKRPASPHPLDY